MALDMVRRDDHCFCCGKGNERGFHLEFSYPEKGIARTELKIPDFCTGWEELTHGGFISMLLDEVMAHACLGRGLQGVTAELTVRFKKPLPVGTSVQVEASAEDSKGRIVKTEGILRDDAGTIYATATAKFMVTARGGGKREQ
jgi:acyl-coenzyme A thioesterase PaaI-like protein